MRLPLRRVRWWGTGPHSLYRADPATFAEQEPSEAKEVMNSREAAAFLRLPYSSFREIAPTLPRHVPAIRLHEEGVAGMVVGAVNYRTS